MILIPAVAFVVSAAAGYYYFFLAGKNESGTRGAAATTSATFPPSPGASTSAPTLVPPESAVPSAAAPIPGLVPPATSSSSPSARPSAGLSPPTPTPAPAPANDALSGGRTLLRDGDYARAAHAFTQEIRGTGRNKYTLGISINCDPANIDKAVNSSGSSRDLFILPTTYDNRSCYRVCWGLFDTMEAAQASVDTLPAYFRSLRPVAVATSRILP
jgi:septal ring-binding cell division protein DamX